MISCADVREELVAFERGESPEGLAADVRYHLGRCAPCAAERDGIRRMMANVRGHINPELSADARWSLSTRLARELERSQRRGLRRLIRPLFVVPAGIAAGVVLALLAGLPGGAVSNFRATEAVAVAVVAPGEADSGGPTEVPSPEALGGVTRGLAWLAKHQRADGTWAPSASSDAESTAAVTASALLAFAADGQSPRRGPNARLLQRAERRLEGLVEEGFSRDADRKPLYAQALAIRALTATYKLDRDRTNARERSLRRALVTRAGRRLVDMQNADGGFGYAASAARSDASCTLFAAAALVDLRDARITDAASALERAAAFLGALRNHDGGLAYTRPGPSTPALTAALLTLDDEIGLDAAAPKLLEGVSTALEDGGDSLLAWTGAAALARRGLPLDAPVRTLLSTQRSDGAFPPSGTDRCAAGGDTLTTAFAVLALAQVAVR